MGNMDLLLHSLEFIENHLCEDIKTSDIAAACHCSKSTLEKLFHGMSVVSVHSYVVRRRMMLAARRISQCPEESILSIALEYGYNSNEAFTRAFKEVWNCNPSSFRNRKFVELFPQQKKPYRKGDAYRMQRKSVDISQLYDLFQERRDCYFACFDIQGMISLNEISRKAGDLAIIEEMNRCNEAAGEEDMVFRIGGDEFCILTDSTSEQYARELVQRILSKNGETFSYGEQQVPLSLYGTWAKFDGGSNLKYEELFEELHMAITESKGTP